MFAAKYFEDVLTIHEKYASSASYILLSLNFYISNKVIFNSSFVTYFMEKVGEANIFANLKRRSDLLDITIFLATDLTSSD